MKSTSRAALFGPFRLALGSRRLYRHATLVPLGGRAVELLVALVERPGEVVTKQELIGRAWPDLFVEEANLRVQMAALRRVLGDGQDGQHYIANIARRGYSFTAEVALIDEAEHEAPREQPIRQNLPLNLTPVLGRDADVAAIGAELERSRLVSIVGPGGVGKTTVALEVARAALQLDAAETPEAVVLVELAPVGEAALVEAVAASSLGLTLGIGRVDLAERLPLDRLLLILDNCEQVVDAAAALAERLIAVNPRLRLLVTSREPLRARAEHVVRLQGLAVPPSPSASETVDALDYPAVRLFIERAAATLGTYTPQGDDLATIAAICRRLDGLPLAIELAAGRVDAFGINGLAQRLDDVFRVLVAGRRTALPRHQTLQATLNWSYDHLSPGEQTTLGRLSVFAGHFSLEAASQVAAIGEPSWDIVEHLTSLVSKSLVAADFSQSMPRYRLLEVTRAYAMQRLIETGERDRLSRRHAAHMRDLMATAEQEWARARPADWLSTYASQLDNIRAALNWAFGPAGDREIGAALTISSAALWFQLSLVEECRSRFEQALASLGEGTPLEPAREVALLTTLGTALIYTVGPGAESDAPLGRARQIARQSQSAELQLRALWGLWLAAFCAGEFEGSLSLAEEFARLARAEGPASRPADLVVAHRVAGISLLFLGRAEEARAALEAALTGDAPASPVARMQYDQRLTGRAFHSMTLYLLGQQDRASELAASNTADARERGHATTLLLTLVDSGCPVALYCGEVAAMEERLALLADVAHRYAFGPWRAWCRCYAGSLHLMKGQFAEAAEAIEDGLLALEQTRWPIRRAFFLGHRAQALEGLGLRGEARHAIDAAIATSRAGKEGWILPELLRVRAGIVSGEEPNAARTDLDEAWSRAAETGLTSWALRVATTGTRLFGSGHGFAGRLRHTVAGLGEGHEKPDVHAARQALAAWPTT